MANRKRFVVLTVDDDDDDWMLVEKSFQEGIFRCEFRLDLRRITDGVKLIEYLDHCMTEHGAQGPIPNLILLDLNMQRMGGLESVKVIKAHPTCRSIPIVIFTTSNDRTTIQECYRCGVNSFIKKPSSFESLKEMIQTLVDYWICTAESQKQ